MEAKSTLEVYLLIYKYLRRVAGRVEVKERHQTIIVAPYLCMVGHCTQSARLMKLYSQFLMTNIDRNFSLYRRRKAREYFIERVRQAYEKVYDEETDTYFYFNKLKGTSQWTTPKVLLGHPFEPRVRA